MEIYTTPLIYMLCYTRIKEKKKQNQNGDVKISIFLLIIPATFFAMRCSVQVCLFEKKLKVFFVLFFIFLYLVSEQCNI